MSGGEPRARLVCRSGALSGRTFDLGEETRIGRAPDNDLVLEAPSVSKRHAVIARREGGFVLEDLDSTYGTRLDGRPVTEPVRLERMHVIEVSDVELVFTRLPAGGGAVGDDAADAGAGSAEADDGEPDEDEAGPGDEAADEGRTLVEKGGFGALPDLGDADTDEPGDTDTDDPGSAAPSDPPDAPEEGRTMVDAGGFGTLPDLEGGGGTDEGDSGGAGNVPSDGSAAGDAGPRDAPGDPGARGPVEGDDDGPGAPSAPPDPPEEGGTVVDPGGFGALPDLEDGEAEDDGDGPGGGEARGGDDGQGSGEGRGGGDAPGGAPGEDDREVEGRGSAEDRRGAEGARAAGDAVETDRDGAAEGARAAEPAAEPSEPAAGFELRVAYSPDRSVAFALEPGDNVVGRSEECDITVDDPDLWLSRKHAVLRVKPEGVELVDLASVNGTFVGGERIERAALTPGSTFHLGPELEFQLRKRS